MTIGKTVDRDMQPLIRRYVDRLGHLAPFVYNELPDVKCPRSAGVEKQKELEGKVFLSNIASADTVILLDERGKGFTSRNFAVHLENITANASGDVVFIIGGPYGFSKEVYARAASMMKLTDMTLTHEMARLLMAEQLYRAYSILRGLPYHHD